MVDEIPEDIVAEFSLNVGRADYRNAFRIKEIPQTFPACGGDVFPRRRFLHKHSGVNGNVAVGVQKQRIKVQLADFRIFDDQLRYFHQQTAERFPIDSLAAITFQNGGAADFRDHFGSVFFRDRQNSGKIHRAELPQIRHPGRT